ncbi:glycosyltransferase [Lactococcus lactis]|uniref:glycosyltransferase n=1 Tax=Lactococcus lactis TaxID=1358 RepID=UPI002FE47A3F
METIFVLDKLDIGGLQRVNTSVANELGKHLSVKIYSLQNSKNEMETSVPVVYGESGNLEHQFVQMLKALNSIYRLTSSKNSLLVIKYQVKKLINYIKLHDVSTVVLSGPSILFVSEIKKKIPDLQCILWMHSTYEVYTEKYFIASKIQFTSSIVKADKIVCLTREDKSKYSNFNINTTYINNPNIIYNDGESSSLNNKVISFVGSLNIEAKGLDYLIEISKHIPDDWVIKVAGEGKDQKVLERLKVNNVIFVGGLSGKDLEKHYLNSSIFISTSRWEGFGLVIIEAMSFGIPIVAFNTTGSREILLDSKFGILVENGNTDQMIAELQKLIISIDLRKKYSKKSLERSKDFEIDNIINQWISLIKDVC